MKKNEIKRILVPVDFSETSSTATTNAMILSQLLKAEVYLICIIENNWHHYSRMIETQSSPPTKLDIENVIDKEMVLMQEKISKTFDIVPEIHIASGNIHTEIIKFSIKNEIDLIVMGTHGVSGYNELFIGSIAQRVISLSELPVLTMQKGCNKPRFKNILIPIDNSLHSREKVNLAIVFANIFDSKLHIVGLIDSDDPQELNKFNTKIKSVEEILSGSDLPKTTTIVHGKNLAKAAIDYAILNKCDLIIINSGHESAIPGVFMGAFAQQLVNCSSIPVLSIQHTPSHYRTGSPGCPDF
ncbi:MAG: universal stress protein [Bacteroidota bacterium]